MSKTPFYCRVLLIVLLGAPALPAAGETREWHCRMLPAEHDISIDPESGAKIVFITTAAADDRNLYFHDRSWLADESLVVFVSNRQGKKNLFGYIEDTGELVEIGPAGDAPLRGVTCARQINRIYAHRGGRVVAIDLHIDRSARTAASVVRATEREIAKIPDNAGVRGSLNENSDGKLLSLAWTDANDPDVNHIAAFEVETGRVVPIATVDYPVWHVQFSWTRPDLLMFSRAYPEGDRMDPAKPRDGPPNHRMWHVDLSGRSPWPIHAQVPGELATHECWWTEGRLTFCGGHRPHESHLKIYDTNTKQISILAAGTWWPEGSAEQITRRAWWHAAGAPNGRWAAADTFHGAIAVFDAKTGEERVLTSGHRVFGSGGAHPHVGWAPSSDRVIFASNQRGQPDVVIGILPDDWQ